MNKLLLIIGVLGLHLSSYATIRYVKAGGSGMQTGDSWANASGDLQLMINQSSSSDIDTIYIAAGSYKPNRPINDLNSIEVTNRANSFTFLKNVRVFGGFPATGNPAWADRNWNTNVTTLSGNIGTENRSDNCYHVVLTLGEDVTADFVMDGLTVSDGQGDNAGDITMGEYRIQANDGAGWHNAGASPTIRNMVFENNIIDVFGGGAGFYNVNGNPIITNAVFRNNQISAGNGGAWLNGTGSPVLNNVLIQGNMAMNGGGWYGPNGSPVMNNVTIVGNSASQGGGLYLRDRIQVTFNNSIVYYNTAGNGPGVLIINSVPGSSASASYNYSLIQGIAGGSNGNLDGVTISPDFVNPVDGTSAPTAAGDYHLTATSPCVDVGSDALLPTGVTTDLNGLNRIVGASVDMGAFEFGNVLPVTLVSFSAEAVSTHSVELKWVTAQETQNDRFVIERSKDLMSFEPVIEVREVAGNSSTLQSYRAIDPAPFIGTSYYRLLQYDIDGTRTASRIVPVIVRSQDYALYPNPVQSHAFRISLDEPVTAKIEVRNASGRSFAFTRKTLDSQTVEISSSAFLPSGAYLITVHERAFRRTFNLIVQ